MNTGRHPAYWVAVGFGAGLSPLIPGTVGTLPLWIATYGIGRLWPPPAWALTVAALILAGIGFWAAAKAERLLGHDPKCVVIDEWAGMMVALIGVPADFKAYLAAFLLFRLFDVVKPFPAALSERLPGGYGVVMDDLVAGLYALATYHLMHAVWPQLV